VAELKIEIDMAKKQQEVSKIVSRNIFSSSKNGRRRFERAPNRTPEDSEGVIHGANPLEDL